MRKGTTPVHTFTLPFEVTSEEIIRIMYVQGGAIILEKHTEDCEVNGNTIKVRLSVADTMRFKAVPSVPVEIQVGIKTESGDQYWSNIIEDPVERCLAKDGEVR